MKNINPGLRVQFDIFVKNYTGSEFFKDLAFFIAEVTQVKYILIGYPENQELTKIKSAVLYAGGSLVDNYSYPLAGTPCENVMGRNCCYYPTGIQQMFPQDVELKELGIESYIGLPIFSESKQALGLIALMDNKIIRNPKEIVEALNVLVPKITSELQANYVFVKPSAQN